MQGSYSRYGQNGHGWRVRFLASRTARTGSRLAGLWLIVAAVMAAAVTGCAAPQYTYIADSGASTYFKVPYGWQKVDDSSLSSVINGKQPAPSGVWSAGYDAAAVPAAAHVLSPAARRPFVFAMVLPVAATARATLTDDGLRDIFLPVTATARQAAALQGARLMGFRLLRDSVLSEGRGIHGVRVVYQYRYPHGQVDTFDQIALTDRGHTQVYVLQVHCVATCYRSHHAEIETVMTSFTVRSS